MLELTQKRTLHSKTHDLGNGRFRLTASMIPMHYEENGQLLDIDMTIQNGVVNSGIYKVELMTNKIGFHAIDRASGKKISVSLGKIGNQSVAYASPVIEGNKATWPSVKPGVDVEFIFNPHQVNIFRVLQNASAEKFAEWEVQNELGDKSIKMNDIVRGRDAAKNETKHTVVIAPPSTANNRKSYVIRDTFEGKSFKRNKKTRVKEEVEPVYPVRIDPTVSITISNTADDGDAQKIISGSATVYTQFRTAVTAHTIKNTDYGGSQNETRVFLRFPGITIPQSSTINSALIQPWINANDFNTVALRVQGKKLNNPSAPTNFNQAFSPATLATSKPVQNITTVAGNYANVDIQGLIQELVNSFDYSNEAMLFFLNSNVIANYPTYKRLRIDDFTGGGIPAKLVIDYTSGGGSSNIKTWNGLADASTKTWNGLARASVKTWNGLS